MLANGTVIPNSHDPLMKNDSGYVEERSVKWIEKILNVMEERDVMPIDDDVWKFLGEINEWIRNPNRLGME